MGAPPRWQCVAPLLALQRRRLQHLRGQLRCRLGEAHVDEKLCQPAARGVVALEARGEAGVAQQLGQALAERLACPADREVRWKGVRVCRSQAE